MIKDPRVGDKVKVTGIQIDMVNIEEYKKQLGSLAVITKINGRYAYLNGSQTYPFKFAELTRIVKPTIILCDQTEE